MRGAHVDGAGGGSISKAKLQQYSSFLCLCKYLLDQEGKNEIFVQSEGTAVGCSNS